MRPSQPGAISVAGVSGSSGETAPHNVLGVVEGGEASSSPTTTNGGYSEGKDSRSSIVTIGALMDQRQGTTLSVATIAEKDFIEPNEYDAMVDELNQK